MRTTLDISDEAYVIAKAVAREQNRSLGSVISDFVLGVFQKAPPAAVDETELFPSFGCKRLVTSEDVRALEDE
ncbi:MAG: hypothetical protein R2762_12590 [Bryobacteraceae bacterium]